MLNKQYTQLLSDILQNGEQFATRGTTSLALFDYQLKLDVSRSAPVITLRNTSPNSAIKEAFWDLYGTGHIDEIAHLPGLQKVWKEYVNEFGYIPNTYHRQLRNWPGSIGDNLFGRLNHKFVDQWANALKTLRSNPASRNIVIQIANPTAIQGLPTCQTSMIFSSNANKLRLSVFCRSQDAIYGLPSDVLRYYVYGQIAAKSANLEFVQLTFNFVNVHIYDNNVDDARDLISNLPNAPSDKFYEIDIDRQCLDKKYQYVSTKLIGKLTVGDLTNYNI